MKRTTQKMALVLGTGLMMIPLAAADCLGPVPGGDGGEQQCELDTDCPDLQQCHPTLQVCEDECVSDADCGGDRPVCNTKGGDGGPYILEVDGIRDLCICDETSCAEGEECSPETGTCVPAGADTCDPANNGSDCPSETPFCDQGVCKAGCSADTDPRLECGQDQICDEDTGECVDLCSPVGALSDDETEICMPDGTFQPVCYDDDCFATGELCDFDPDSTETFNQCVLANDVTGTCPDAAGHDQETDGPIIYDVAFVSDAGSDGTCAHVLTFSAWVYSETPFDQSLYSQRLVNLSEASGLTYSAGANSGLHPSVEPLDGFPNEYDLTFFLCGDMGTPPDFAIYLTNNDGAAGNAYCFAGQ